MPVYFLLIFFVIFILAGIPVGFSMISSSALFILLEGELTLFIITQRITSGLDSFPFLAIPLFVFAGSLFNETGSARRIFNFALTLVGHVKGSMAQVNVIASIIFAGMSGVAQADAAGLGTIEIQSMIEEGYDRGLSAAITSASSIIGPIIPPSVIMIIFALVARVPPGTMFIAGIIPGFIMGLSLMLTIYYRAIKGKIDVPTRPRATLKEVKMAFIAAFPSMIAPFILVVGLLTGVATVTELGGLLVLYAIILGFIYGEFTWGKLLDSLNYSLITFSVLTFIIAAAVPFGWLTAIRGLPRLLAETLFGLTTNYYLILLLMNILFLIAGAFVETTALLLMITPIFQPFVVNQLGVHPIHFGLILIINLLIGANTPPFGVCLFICMEIAGATFEEIIKEIIPFLVPLIITLLLVTFIPQLTLFLPRLFNLI